MKNKNLGKIAKDKVTGFTGTIVAVVYYLNGCTQYCIKPAIDKDNKMPDGEYIDVQQVEILKNGTVVKPKNTGGPQPDCPRH